MKRPHLVRGQFQSDKYPTCPRGKVPLSVKDPTAQDLLWEYAQRRRSVDTEFSADLETALLNAGYRQFKHGTRVRLKKPEIGQTKSIGFIKGRPRLGSKLAYVVWPDGWAGTCLLAELEVVGDV